MLKTTAVIILTQVMGILLQPLSAASSDPHLVATARFDDHWTAYSTGGKVKIDLREVQVEATGPYGKPVPYRIVVIFEPLSGTFSWRIFSEDSPRTMMSRQTLAYKKERAVFLKENHLISFMAEMAPLNLNIQDVSGHASNMDDAEAKALTAAAKLSHPTGILDFAQQLHIVPLTGLSVDFVHSPGNAIFGPQPTVTDVQWDGKYWTVTLEARWKEAITLDSDYTLISMRKVE